MRELRINRHVWQAMALPIVLLMTACGPSEPTAAPALAADMDIDTLLHQGESIYEQNCAMCHYAGDGGGMNPSLIASELVKKSPEGLVRVILKGQRGISEVDGKKLNGIMPPQAYLNDVEVAAVATYVRREFGKVEEPVQPSVSAKVRASP